MVLLIRLFIVLFFCSTGNAAFAEKTLTYSVIGLKGELQSNAMAFLGPPPESQEERLEFLDSVASKVGQSLQAVGYYRPIIKISVDKTKPNWAVDIQVTPNEPVRFDRIDIQVKGEASNDPPFVKLFSEAPFVRDQVLHHGHYEVFKTSLQSLGQQRGYFDGNLEVSRIEVNPANNTANLQLVYESGSRYRFGATIFDGNQSIPRPLKSIKTFKQGEYFDLSKLQQFQGQLQQSRYYSSVVVRPEIEDAENNEVPLSVTLYPAKRHSFDIGVGYSTDTEERTSLTWRSPLLNRFGHSQETRLEYSPVNPSGRLVYKIPVSHPLNDIVQLMARIEKNVYGDLDSRQKGLSVRREIKSESWIRSYSLRGLNESWDVARLRNTNNYVLPGVTFSKKVSSGLPVDPTDGFSQYYRVEAGSESAGSDINLLNAYTKFGYIKTFRNRHRFVFRGELGMVFISSKDREDLAPSLTFFAGGSQSIRGFAYQSIGNEVIVENLDGMFQTLTVGGDRLLTANMEYQYYINERWRGAAFFDAGDAFDEGQYENNYSPGFGIHYLTPAGAMKLEFGYSLSEVSPSWRFHLNFGAEF